MSERGGGRRGAGAPFYAPARRKTSAEIISEARAAVYGEAIKAKKEKEARFTEMSSASGGSASDGGVGSGALRPLRTRRPFTPRDPQRTLFTDRTRRRDARPPSAFSLKYLSLSEAGDEPLASSNVRTMQPGYGPTVRTSHEVLMPNQVQLPEGQGKKPGLLRTKSRSMQESVGWAGFPKLPHLSGRSKPLHRRNTEESKIDWQLANAISVTQPLGLIEHDVTIPSDTGGKAIDRDRNMETSSERRKQYMGSKTLSYDDERRPLGDIPVKHLAVQLPHAATLNDFDSMTTLKLAESLSQRSNDTDRTLVLLNTLQGVLESAPPSIHLRDLVLRALYAHIDSDDERVLVAIARSMLTMRVIGGHLSAACKLVFKVARNDKNDHFFKTTNLLDLLVEGCGRACPLTEGECCVYGAGALRFLTLEPRLRLLAHHAGALHLAALHLKILNTAKADHGKVSEESIHALYQVTGALRNLLGGTGPKEAEAVLASGALPELLAALPLYVTDRDVLTNVVRCLSVVSAEESCCLWLCSAPGGAGSLLTALASCAARAPLAVRLAYTLGNMAAADERARLDIYGFGGGVDVLLTILESYAERGGLTVREPLADPDIHLVDSDLGGSDGSSEDVLIKTVRVIANMCLAESAGRGLAAEHAHRTVRALLACLALAERSNEHNDKVAPESTGEESKRLVERREELAIAALATLNNFTFYREPPDPPDPLEDLIDELCRVACWWVTHGVTGGGLTACEAVRALGNVSRWPRAAHALLGKGVLQALTPYLQHEEIDVRCSAAGVLVNVCGAGSGGAGEEAGAVAARALATSALLGDAVTAALLARALWNALAHAPLSAAQAQQVAEALSHFIDDESVFAACEAARPGGGRRASDPPLEKHHVKFDMELKENSDFANSHTKFSKSHSVGHHLHHGDADGGCSGEDLGFEEGDLLVEEDCECSPCRRLAVWEELAGVAIPLLEKLTPARVDASVGTD